MGGGAAGGHRRPAARQAWGWMLLLAGLLAYALPFIGFVAGGSRLDAELAGRVGDLLAAVLASDLLAAGIGPEVAEIGKAWLMALDDHVFSLAWLASGTLLLVTGLMAGKELRDPAPSSGDSPPPGVLNVITAQRGRYTYHIYAHRALSEKEMIQLVGEAIEDGRLAEPEPGGTATLITRIGLEADATGT